MFDIIIIVVLIIVISILGFFSIKKIVEGFDTSEAISNIASIYNTEQMKVTNLDVIGKFNQLPKGIIVAWYGDQVPSGWALCDGTNGTPDLRNRFIYGSALNEKGKTGGQDQIKLSVSNIPPHTHSYTRTAPWSGSGGFEGGKYGFNFPATQSGSVGGGAPFNILPPFIKMAFIMKL